VASTPFSPIVANAPFVKTSGRNFTLNGKPFFFGGTSWYDALVVSSFVN